MSVLLPFDAALHVLLQVGALLVVAWSLGELAARLGVTRVVGELATGFVLGPSLLGAVAPDLHASLFHGGESLVLEGLSLLGLVLLLALAGLEMDFALVRANAADAVAVAALGLALPFVLGTALGFSLPPALLGAGTSRLVFALFLATAISISAIPVIVRILVDLGAFDRPFGQLTIAAAMVTDVVGWVALSVVVGIARTGRLDLASFASVVLAVVGFVVAAFVVGGRALEAALARIGEDDVGVQFFLVVAAAVLGGALTIALGIEPALGAFVAGLLFARSGGVAEAAVATFERLTLRVFAPLFFGIAGLQADLGLLLDPTVAAVGALTLVFATVGKVLGVGIAALARGYSRTEAFGMGAALNARGAIEIVIAAVGLELGILGPEMYTVVLGVAVATSAMAPPLLGVALERLPA